MNILHSVLLLAPIVLAPAESSHVRAPEDYVPLYGAGQLQFPAYAGPWRMLGYGTVFQFEPEGLRVFSESSAGSWELDAAGFIELEELWVVATEVDEANPPGQRRLLSLDPSVSPYTIERLDQLPPACLEEIEWTPTRVFEAFAATFGDYYPFFEVRNFDWEARVADVRAAVANDMSEEALFEALLFCLDGLGDGHVSLSAEIEGRRFATSGGLSRIEQRAAAALDVGPGDPRFEAQLAAAVRSISAAAIDGIREYIVPGELHEPSPQYKWGWATDRIGYLMISGMGDESGGDLPDQLARAHEIVEELLAELEGMQALVIDISFNGGGMDAFSHVIASHFADQPRLAYSKGPGAFPELRHPVHIAPCPTATFTGPIYLVSSDLTASAAEIFQLCMRVQPHVQLVGALGHKIFSDAIPKTLPNGWDLSLSIEVYRDADGICYEGLGVPLDHELPLFEGEDLLTTHTEALERIIGLADESL